MHYILRSPRADADVASSNNELSCFSNGARNGLPSIKRKYNLKDGATFSSSDVNTYHEIHSKSRRKRLVEYGCVRWHGTARRGAPLVCFQLVRSLNPNRSIHRKLIRFVVFAPFPPSFFFVSINRSKTRSHRLLGAREVTVCRVTEVCMYMCANCYFFSLPNS